MSSEEKIDGWKLEQFQEKAPDLLGLAESFMEGADERWYIQGVADGPGWWGEDDGFWLDRTVADPGYEHGFDLVIWIGKDHAHIRVLLDWDGDGDWRLDADYRMEHADLRAYLDSLPKPFTAYGATMVEVEHE